MRPPGHFQKKVQPPERSQVAPCGTVMRVPVSPRPADPQSYGQMRWFSFEAIDFGAKLLRSNR